MKVLSIFHPVRFFATGFGTGCVPKIGGTSGSFLGLILAWPLHAVGNEFLLIVSVLMFFFGWGLCALYLYYMPHDNDPKEIVIDEIAGQWLLLAVFPQSLQSYLIAFIVFRLFDIVKPYPISHFDRTIKGAFGIMFDDMLAAVYPVFIFILVLLVSTQLGSPLPIDSMYNALSGDAHVF